MADDFDNVMSDVKARYAQLIESPAHTIASLPGQIPAAGVYLFSEHGTALYVGRTDKLRQRLRYHTRNSHNQATFAFLLARHETGRLRASYRREGSRADLLRDPEFSAAFQTQRERIRTMDVRWVEEPESVRQAILEIYAAYMTDAKYSHFHNT